MTREHANRSSIALLAQAGDVIDALENSVDWSQIEPLVSWVGKSQSPSRRVHPPLRLLRAVLLQQSLGLTSSELEYELGDRRSLRRFIDLDETEEAPSPSEISEFLQNISDAGIADEVFEQIARQISHSDVSDQAQRKAERYPLASDTRMFRPPGWVSLEKRFLAFWEQGAIAGRLPRMSEKQILHRLAEIEPHVLTLEVSKNTDEFRYRHAGENIETANGGAISGKSINNKLSENLAEYNHPGIQGDILAICKRAISELKPVGLSSFFINAIGQRCQIWILIAPYVDPETEITGLTGVSMIIPVEALSVGGQNASDRLMTPSLATLSTFARPPASPEWARLENRLITYWNKARGDKKTPGLRDINLKDISDLGLNLTLIRVNETGDDFQYEHVGEDIEASNEGRISGTRLAEQVARNNDEYGHGGLQADLVDSYCRAVRGLAPASTSRHFANARGHLRQLWSVQAPLSNDEGTVEMLIGVMLVKPLSVN
jgi:hypothetical protein